MPGFTTHYLFGVNTYRALKRDSIKKLIHEHHAAYSLGQQGPDIFFYYLPSYLLHPQNVGSVAHRRRTGRFLSYLIDSQHLFPDPKELAIARAYILGFLGHYLLDSHCHPYVYWRSHYAGRNSNYHWRHMNLEVDIDTQLLDLYKKRQPSCFRQNTTLLLNPLEVRTIASLLYYAYSLTYPEMGVTHTDMRLAIRTMQWGTRLLFDPRGQKKVLVRKAEGMILGHPVVSPMIASDSLQFYGDPLNVLHTAWNNPWAPEKQSTDSFLDLMESTQQEYLEILDLTARLFASKIHSSAHQIRRERLLNRLGNLSYHSGLDTSIDTEGDPTKA